MQMSARDFSTERLNSAHGRVKISRGLTTALSKTMDWICRRFAADIWH